MTPHFADDHLTVYIGDCREVMAAMPAESVHCVVTSPPYFGLRDYGTATWEGGDAECDHLERTGGTGKSTLGEASGGHAISEAGQVRSTERSFVPAKHTCRKCGARRVDDQIGLEVTPGEYVADMVAVFREIKRVLRDDGTVWLNLGDSYAGTGKSGGGEQGHRAENGAGAPTAGRPGEWLNFRPAPEGLKNKDLVGIPWRTAFALQADGWYLRSDIVWCLSATTRLYARTPHAEGPATIHDLVRLDPATVELWTGERWTHVRGWSSRQADTIRLTLRSGERISTTAEHRWPTTKGLRATSELVAGDVLRAARLPEPEQPTGPALDNDLAWFAGLYLAEGSRSDDAIQIAGHAREVARHERVADIARRFGGSSVMHRGPGNSVSVVVHGAFLDAAIKHFIAGRTALDKHLHPRAWRSSDATLRAFMDGYLAGDGAYDSKNDRWRLGFGDNAQWADSLRTLAARLGATLTLAPSLARIGRTLVFEAYRGEWRWASRVHHNAKDRGEVIKIEHRGSTEVWDIGVAAEPHLFALASGVLTHNSKPNPMPESVTDRPTKAHEYVFLLTKSATYYFDQEAVRESGQSRSEAPVSAVREGPGAASRQSRDPRGTGEGPSAGAPVLLLHPEGQGVTAAVSPERQGQGEPSPWGPQTSGEHGDREHADGSRMGRDQGRSASAMPLLWGEGSADDGPPGAAVEGWPAQRGERGSGLSELQQREGKPLDKQRALGKATYSGFNDRWDASVDNGTAPVGRNIRSVWTIATQPYPGAHFATFPEKLVEPCVKAGTSERGVCPECGAPWMRETGRSCASCAAFIPTQGKSCPECGHVNDWKAERGLSSDLGTTDWSSPGKGTPRKLGASGKDATVGSSKGFATGWRPSCACGGQNIPDPIPATVLDPFAGSGTTGRVANRLSRRAILIDLSAEYIDQAMLRNAQAPLGLA